MNFDSAKSRPRPVSFKLVPSAILYVLLSPLPIPAIEMITPTEKPYETSKYRTFSDYKEKTVQFMSPYTQTGYGKNCDKFLSRLGNLPTELQEGNSLIVDGDKTGRFWAVNQDDRHAIMDGESGSPIYKSENSREMLHVSPGGRFIVIDYPDTQACEDCYPLMGLKRIPSLETVVDKADKVSIQKFIGAGERWGVVSKDGQTGLAAFSNPAAISYVSQDETPNFDNCVEIPGSDEILGISKKDEVTLWHMPDLQVVKTIPDLSLGHCFVNDGGTIIGTYDLNTVFFYNLATGQTKGFGLSREDENLLLELGKKNDFSIPSGQRPIIPAGAWDITSAKSLGSSASALSLADIFKNRSGHLGPGGRNKKNRKTRVVGTFAEGNEIGVVFSSFDAQDNQKGNSTVAYVNESLEITHVVQCLHPLSPNMTFDPRTKRIQDFDARTKELYGIPLD